MKRSDANGRFLTISTIYLKRLQLLDRDSQAFQNVVDETVVAEQTRFLHEQHVTNLRHLDPNLQEEPRLVPDARQS